jgi:hypothetical protein
METPAAAPAIALRKRLVRLCVGHKPPAGRVCRQPPLPVFGIEERQRAGAPAPR